jgi:hypothetical protein
MATSPVPQWAQEMSPHHRGPTIAGTLVMLAVATVLLLLVLLSSSPSTDAAAVCAALAAHLRAGVSWPLSSSPGRSSLGPCCLGSRPGSGRTGRTRSLPRSSRGPARGPNNPAPTPRHCHANATPLLARSYLPALGVFPQVDSPLGPESPAKPAGDSGPCGERNGASSMRARFARRISSIQPGCRGPARGSVVATGVGRR